MSVILPYQPARVLPPRRVGRIVTLLGVLLVTSWVIGGVTNSVNALISPEYFDVVIRRSDFASIVLQGLLESTVAAFLLWGLLLPVYCGVTGCRLPVRRLVPVPGAVLAVAMACHVVGGVGGYAWARFAAASFVRTFGVPISVDVPRFGYVGGAIWGTYASGAVGLVMLYVGVVRCWQGVTEA